MNKMVSQTIQKAETMNLFYPLNPIKYCAVIYLISKSDLKARCSELLPLSLQVYSQELPCVGQLASCSLLIFLCSCHS